MMNKSLKKIKDLFNSFKIEKLKPNFNTKTITDVAKLVDALDLGPSNFCFESSSLSIRNLNNKTIKKVLKLHNLN